MWLGHLVTGPDPEELADLLGDEQRERSSDADEPLFTGQGDHHEELLEDVHLGGENDEQDRETGGLDEHRIVEDVAGEDRARFVRRLQRRDDAEQRERGHAHGLCRRVVEFAVGPGHDGKAACPDPEPDEGKPGVEPQRQDLLALRPWLLVHQAVSRLAEPEPDRLADVDRQHQPHGLDRLERGSAQDVEDRRTEEHRDVGVAGGHLEADEAQQVVVDVAADADRLDDGGVVVVGEDHVGRGLGDLGAGDPHGDADVGLLDRRCVVHAVTGHGHDVVLLPQDVHELHLVLGCDSADHADVVDLTARFLVAHGAEVGTGDSLALDAQLLRDDLARECGVTGDHADLHAGCMALGDGRLGGGSRRVGDADERHQLEPLDGLQEIGVRVEGGRVEVLDSGGHQPHAQLGHPVPLGEVAIVQLRDGERLAVGAVDGRGALEELVRRSLDVGPHDLLAALVGPVVKRGHELVGGIERQRRDARVGLACLVDVDAAFGREHDERTLGGVTRELAVAHLGVGAQGHRHQERLELDRGLAGRLGDLALRRVPRARDGVAALGEGHRHRGHLVHRQGAGLVRVERGRGAERLDRAQLLDDGTSLCEQLRAPGQDGRVDGREGRRDGGDHERDRGQEEVVELPAAREADGE